MPASERHSIDGDLRRKTDEFLASNPSLSKKLDDLDRLMMGNFLQTQLQHERNGWRSSMSKAMEELERHRKLTLQLTGSDADGEYKLQKQFTDYREEEEEKEEEEANPEVQSEPGEAEADSAETAQLREQLSEALEKASAASELAWHYENFIRELKSINAKLEARLTQLAQERRHCARLLAAGATGDEGLSGRGVDLYKAIRELQNRCEQLTREQHQKPLQAYCSACGSAMSSSAPMSDGGDANGKIMPNAQQQQQQPQSTQRDQIVAGAILGWKRGVRVLAGAKPSDIAVVPLRPRHQQPTQQPTQQPDPTDDATQTEQPQSDPLADSLTENARLRRDLHALAKALRTAEEDAKEKAKQLAAYEKQVASMKHAFTYRQPLPPPHPPTTTQLEAMKTTTSKTTAAADGATAAAVAAASSAAAVNNSLPILNLARNTQKRSRGAQQQQQQQQQQQVMPAKTSVTRCLRCQKLYRLVDNNKFACKYHSKGRQRVEQHSSQGRLADVLFVWDCCGRLANAEGCCFSEHI